MTKWGYELRYSLLLGRHTLPTALSWTIRIERTNNLSEQVVVGYASPQAVFLVLSLSLSVSSSNFFTSTGQANCVNDLPDLKASIPEGKPGLYYGADEQCKMAFGAGAMACTFTRHDTVSRRLVLLGCNLIGGSNKCYQCNVCIYIACFECVQSTYISQVATTGHDKLYGPLTACYPYKDNPAS